MLTPTVRVESISPTIIKMSWDKIVRVPDVDQAYREINRLLNLAPRPIFVLVDISCNPQFPVGATIKGALLGPHQNPKLQAWLVVGTSVIGHMIDHILTKVTRRKIVVWFNTETEALGYAAEVIPTDSL
jgi:hypothetical protein